MAYISIPKPKPNTDPNANSHPSPHPHPSPSPSPNPSPHQVAFICAAEPPDPKELLAAEAHLLPRELVEAVVAQEAEVAAARAKAVGLVTSGTSGAKQTGMGDGLAAAAEGTKGAGGNIKGMAVRGEGAKETGGKEAGAKEAGGQDASPATSVEEEKEEKAADNKATGEESAHKKVAATTAQPARTE